MELKLENKNSNWNTLLCHNNTKETFIKIRKECKNNIIIAPLLFSAHTCHFGCNSLRKEMAINIYKLPLCLIRFGRALINIYYRKKSATYSVVLLLAKNVRGCFRRTTCMSVNCVRRTLCICVCYSFAR